MSRGVNKAILMGHLGRDPESRMTASGSALVNLSVATTESWKNRSTGVRSERTEWHRVVAFGQQAEFAAQHLKKGAMVYVEGRLRTRKWTDREGKERYSTEVVAVEIKALGGRPDARPVDPALGGVADPGQEEDQFDDDIPF